MATKTAKWDKQDGADAVRSYFEEESPVLVEVGFVRMGTSSDWYLFEEFDAFAELMGRLEGTIIVYLRSVWNIDEHEMKVTLKRTT